MASSRSQKIRAKALTAGVPFQSGAMRGYWVGDSYMVSSYAVTIGAINRDGAILYYNATKYSATTSAHQSALRKAWGLSGAPIGAKP
jgi:hypothetical protein